VRIEATGPAVRCGGCPICVRHCPQCVGGGGREKERKKKGVAAVRSFFPLKKGVLLKEEREGRKRGKGRRMGFPCNYYLPYSQKRVARVLPGGVKFQKSGGKKKRGKKGKGGGGLGAGRSLSEGRALQRGGRGLLKQHCQRIKMSFRVMKPGLAGEGREEEEGGRKKGEKGKERKIHTPHAIGSSRCVEKTTISAVC